jgi:spectinomycin phosphotransferase
VAEDGTAYFLKLREDDFDESSVAIPKFLSDRGVGPIIVPLATRDGQLWVGLDSYKVILYPFVEGRNGYQVGLSNRHWREFGAALKWIHTIELPPALSRDIRPERCSPQWRNVARSFLQRVEPDGFDDPLTVKTAAFLQAHRAEIIDLVERAEQLARSLRARSPTFVLCHADLHAGNFLLDPHGPFYLVDWDTLTLAPKERDLMFIGGGLLGGWRTPEEEETLFYQAYGQTDVDPIALAYYRYERIIQDIAVFCERIFSTNEAGADRAQSFQYLASNFLSNGPIELACRSDLRTDTYSI